eukprot:m.219118 g.219118  ORF g.219118 m.219118 type:complete len:509 (+) comp54132_c0_seq1:495-2021(+)
MQKAAPLCISQQALMATLHNALVVFLLDHKYTRKCFATLWRQSCVLQCVLRDSSHAAVQQYQQVISKCDGVSPSALSSHEILELDHCMRVGALDVVAWVSSQAEQQTLALLTQFWSSRLAPAFRGVLTPALQRCSIVSTRHFQHATWALLVSDARAEISARFETQWCAALLAPPLHQPILGMDLRHPAAWHCGIIDAKGQLMHAFSSEMSTESSIVSADSCATIVERVLRDHDCHVLAFASDQETSETQRFLATLHSALPELLTTKVDTVGLTEFTHSDCARKEHPSLSAGLRAPISIARRLQHPFKEYSKLSVFDFGERYPELRFEGLESAFQQLKERVLSSAILDLNDMNESQLAWLPGVSCVLASAILTFHQDFGSFSSREQLLQVPGMTPDIYLRMVPFVRVFRDPSLPTSPPRNPGSCLDSSAIPPSLYGYATRLLQLLGAQHCDFGSSELRHKATSALIQDKTLARLTQDMKVPREAIEVMLRALQESADAVHTCIFTTRLF